MRNIVVIGGGFAGTALVRALERHLPTDWQLKLVSDENYMIYTPLLPEVVGASLMPGHAVAPLRKMLRRTRYYRACVQDIDLQRRTISYIDGRPHNTSYEYLVFAFGKVPDINFIEGMADHALPLKTLGDALRIRNRVIVALENAELEDDPVIQRLLTTFIIIGGGSSGVEVAGAIADFLHAASRYYPHSRDSGGKVVLLESGERVLAEFPDVLAGSAMQRMRTTGIEIHLGTRVTAVAAEGVKIDNGTWIAGNNIICTIGSVQNPLVEKLSLPTEKGLIKTHPDMSVAGLDGVWAIGDCAAIMNAEDGKLSPPTAQFAVRQGKQLAQNILRATSGQVTHPFRYRSVGQLASIGHRRAVGCVMGIKLSGFPAWLLWRAVYLFMLPTSLRKLQVFFEWSLEMLFPRDITQLRLSLTKVRRETSAPRESKMRSTASN